MCARLLFLYVGNDSSRYHRSDPIQILNYIIQHDNNIDDINVSIKIEFNSQPNHTGEFVDNNQID